MMKRTNNRKGFTLAEVLIVVGILVVLMGVGFVALTSHARNMHQLEMDGQAKEIFVAAQNHLAMAEGQGYAGVSSTGFGTKETAESEGEEEDPDLGIYYFIVPAGEGPGSTSTALGQMLPFAAVDESARTGGSYIIRYQKSPAVILDVFYASNPVTDKRYGFDFGNKDDDYDYSDFMELAETEGMTEADRKAAKDARKSFGDTKAVLGYYGGVTASELIKSSVSLQAPALEVINAEKLQVKVTNFNELDTLNDEKKTSLTLIITGKGSDGTVEKAIELISDGDIKVGSGNEFLLTLDDVTGTQHFANFWNEAIAGANISIKAVAFNNHVATNIAESSTEETNSLFASYDPDSGTVEVSNLRHLINLDKSISDYGITVSKAEQISNLDWTQFKKNVGDAAGNTTGITSASASYRSADGSFLPVGLGAITYEGKGLQIKNITIDGDKISISTKEDEATVTDPAPVGLFSELSGTTVQNLELIDFNVKSEKAAGALAGTASNATITGVLVHNTQGAPNSLQIQSTGSAAGGLVGSLTGTSTVDKCAAAVYVSAAGDAGGLIGTASTTTITDSYSGGHTKDGRYTDLTSGDGRINVISTGASAGGLIGHVTGSGNSISYSYSTASAIGDDAAGGLIGSVAEDAAATVSFTYSTGKVFLTGTATGIYPFIGAGFDQVTYAGGNYYLANVSENTLDYVDNDEDGDNRYANLACVTKGSKDVKTFIINNDNPETGPEEKRQEAVVYDKTLLVDYAGRYFFPTVKQLHYLHVQAVDEEGERVYPDAVDYSASSEFAETFTARHYGDWQVPGLTPLNYTFVNEHTLYTDVTLEADTDVVTFALYGESSQVARVFILDVQRSDSGVSLSIKREGVVRKGANTITDWKTSDFSPIVFGTPDASGVFRVTLDDISAYVEEDEEKVGSGHFAQLFADSFADDKDKTSSKLSPGENVTLLVGGGEGSWTELKDLKETTWASLTAAEKEKAEAAGQSATYNSCAKTENSLFGPMSSGNAQIVYYRHLQNLDEAVSAAGSVVSSATLNFAGENENKKNTKWYDVAWSSLTAGDSDTTTYQYVYNADGTKYVEKDANGVIPFTGIYNPNLTKLDGKNYTIENMVISAPEAAFVSEPAAVKGNAGFFRYVPPQNKDEDDEEGESYTFTISNLHLKDVSVSGSGNVGAFVGGAAASVTLDTVLAEADGTHSITTTGGAAGGLVGLNTGNTTIENSAASMLVSATGAAGGLVGKQDGTGTTVSIHNSYVGGHTTDGKYTWLEAGAVTGNWNIVSTGGAAGGMLGELTKYATAKIEQSFNAATVLSGTVGDEDGQAGGIIGLADGQIQAYGSDGVLHLVYVVAPVANVQKIVFTEEDGEWTSAADEGNAGSLIGLSNQETFGDGAGYYYLPDTYLSPALTIYGNDKSSIKAIGTGTLMNEQIASYYVGRGSDAILGIGSAGYGAMEQKTEPFDGSLSGEFPFSIWTKFRFADDNNDGELNASDDLRVFRGDWQPVEDEPTKKLIVHFLTVIPGDTNTGVDRQITKALENREIAVQIPYREAKITLPFAYDKEGYNTGKWFMYIGDWSSASSWTGDSISSDKKLETCKDGGANGTTVTLLTQDFNRLLTEGKDASGALHLSVVSTYLPMGSKLYKLVLHDIDPADPEADYDNADGSIYQVLVAADDNTTVGDILNGKLSMRSRSIDRYRFRGWYTGEKCVGDRYYLTKFVGSSLVGELNSAFTGAKISEVVNDKGELHLYAGYQRIPTQKLVIHFKLKPEGKDDLQDLSDNGYEIDFDAEKGFNSALPLPADASLTLLTPVANALVHVDGTEEATSAALNASSKTLTVTVNPHAEITNGTALGNIEYNVIFTGEDNTVKVGYVVRYVLKDTKWKNDTHTLENAQYDKEGGEKVYNPNIVGATPRGKLPTITAAKIPGFTGRVLNPVKVYSTMTSSEKTKYEVNNDQVSVEGEANPLNLFYVFIVEYTRDTYVINLNTEGGSIHDPIPVVFGDEMKGFGSITPTRNGYTFLNWTLDGETISETDKKTMPAHNVTLLAKWEAKEVPYSVTFWYENTTGNGWDFMDSIVINPNDRNNPYPDRVKKVGDTVRGYTFRDHVFDGRDPSHFTYDHDDDEKTVAANGTTIVNLYFKRADRTIDFYLRGYWRKWTNTDGDDAVRYAEVVKDTIYERLYKEEMPADYYWFARRFEKAINDDDKQFALVNGEYVELERRVVDKYTWIPDFVYTNTGNNEDDQYRLYNGEYYPLYFESDYPYNYYYYYYSGEWYSYEKASLSGNGGYYYTYDVDTNTYNQYYFTKSNGNWYYYINYNWQMWYGGDVYTTKKFSGTRYKRAEGTTPVATRYSRTGSSAPYTYTVTEATDGDLYWQDNNRENNADRYGHGKLIRSGSQEIQWYLDGVRYTDQRYKQSDTETMYKGTRYTRTGENAPYTYTETTSTEASPQYGIDIYGGHFELERKYISGGDRWYYYSTTTKEKVYYEDDHWVWVDGGNSTLFQRWVGKWNSTFAENNYKWDYVNDYSWHRGSYSGGGQTFMDAFTQDTTPYNLYGTKPNSQPSAYVYHYRQTLDGKFIAADRETAKLYGNDLSFEFERKFGAFTPYRYNFGKLKERGDGTSVYNNKGQFISVDFNREKYLHVYHTRDRFDLTFMSGNTEVRQENVLYQAPLTAYKNQAAGSNPAEYPASEGYTFDGNWYTDETLQTRFEFETLVDGEVKPVEMPSHNLTLYAGWFQPKSTVTFQIDLADGQTMPGVDTTGKKTESNIDYGASLMEKIAKEEVNYSEYKDEYKAAKTGYIFKGWYIAEINGVAQTEKKDFYPSMMITQNLTLKPKFDKEPDKSYKDVTFVCYECDPTTFEKIKVEGAYVDLTNKVAADDRAALLNLLKDQEVGLSSITVAAPAIEDYVAVYNSAYCEIVQDSGANVIEFLYYPAVQWSYKVKYVVRFPSVEKGWVPDADGVTFADEDAYFDVTLPQSGDLPTASGSYKLVTFSMPEALGSGYRFEKFVDQNGNETKDPFVLVIQGRGSTVPEVTAYVVPDEASFPQSDQEAFYTGSTLGIDSAKNGTLEEEYTAISAPTGVTGTPTIHYVYTGSGLTAEGKPKDVGAYGVKTYVTLVEDGTTYILWKSEENSMHFYVKPREVILKSATAHFFNVAADVTLPEGANIHRGSVAVADQQTDVVIPTEVSTALAGIRFYFSAEAFRTAPSYSKQDDKVTFSSTPNVFSYDPPSGIEGNYSIFKEFGQLFVWNSVEQYTEYRKQHPTD